MTVAIITGLFLVTVAAVTVLGNLFLQDRKELRERVDKLEKRERIRDDYIVKLRGRILRGDPPPPPPYPEGLTNG
jgi:hypothetical protein